MFGRGCDFLAEYPLKSGYWADGHTDNSDYGNTYKSNTATSDFTLALFDYPDLDPDWRSDVPKLIKWTEDNFVFRCAPGEPATEWGANIVGEQNGFLPKMDYQTARYAAECARWYAVSGDEAYKEKALRAPSASTSRTGGPIFMENVPECSTLPSQECRTGLRLPRTTFCTQIQCSGTFPTLRKESSTRRHKHRARTIFAWPFIRPASH